MGGFIGKHSLFHSSSKLPGKSSKDLQKSLNSAVDQASDDHAIMSKLHQIESKENEAFESDARTGHDDEGLLENGSLSEKNSWIPLSDNCGNPLSLEELKELPEEQEDIALWRIVPLSESAGQVMHMVPKVSVSASHDLTPSAAKVPSSTHPKAGREAASESEEFVLQGEAYRKRNTRDSKTNGCAR
eukprot:760664-Hanusia_phi.AAC.4